MQVLLIQLRPLLLPRLVLTTLRMPPPPPMTWMAPRLVVLMAVLHGRTGMTWPKAGLAA